MRRRVKKQRGCALLLEAQTIEALRLRVAWLSIEAGRPISRSEHLRALIAADLAAHPPPGYTAPKPESRLPPTPQTKTTTGPIEDTGV